MKKFLQNFQISKIDDFHSKSLNFAENHRSEVLSHRAPEDTIRKDFVHTFKFLNPQAPQKYLHTSGTPYVSAKNSISTFSPISVYSQTTKEIVHKNVFYHSDIIFFENSRKSWVSEKKITFESDAHSAVWWRSQLLQLGTGFRKKKASFNE